MKYFKEFRDFIKEEGSSMVGGTPTNSDAGGSVAGLGVTNPYLPNQSEPGVDKKKKKKKTPVTFKNMITRKIPEIEK